MVAVMTGVESRSPGYYKEISKGIIQDKTGEGRWNCVKLLIPQVETVFLTQ